MIFAPSIAFIDVETTGTTPTGDRITEIGIVRVEDGQLVEEWSSLVNPECSIPEEIQVLTGITNAMVRAAPTFAELRREVHERLDGHLFVAHNARFDYGFIKNEFRRVEMPFTADVLCTVRLSRRLYPHEIGHGLDAVIARHGLEDAIDAAVDAGAAFENTSSAMPRMRAGRHSALGDARVLWRFVQTLYREKEVADIAAAVRRLLKIPSLPPQLPPDALENLPEAPGVYRFYGVNDLPIYIGKSINLRDRVRSHFSSDYRSANDVRISGEIQRIEVEETAGELGALLTEARLVKKLLPLHNYRLRRKLNACFVRLPDLRSPPQVLFNKDIDWGAREPGAESLFGPFAARLNVRRMLEGLAGEEGLCWRQLGWEKRGGPCFARQVRKCRGACVGEETPEQHSLRLATALAPYRVRDWPWPGRVVVTERNLETGREEAHVFDRWCHVGTARSDEDLADLQLARVEIDFDPDIYKILTSYVAKHPCAVKVMPAAPPEYADAAD